MTAGLPFFALSANSPLLQRWFSLTKTRQQRIRISSMPRAMWAASSHSLAIRWSLSRSGGSLAEHGWAAAFVVLLALVAGCGFAWFTVEIAREVRPKPERRSTPFSAGPPVGAAEVVRAGPGAFEPDARRDNILDDRYREHPAALGVAARSVPVDVYYCFHPSRC